MKVFRFALSILCVLGAAPVLAQDYDRSGMYGQLNGVASFDSIDGVPSSALDTAIGVSGRIGYRFSPRLAFEGQLEYSGDFACCGADITATVVTANGKFFVMTERAQPYLLWGLGGAFGSFSIPGFGSAKDSGFAVKIGGGLDYYVSESWGLTGEVAYNIGTGDLEDFNYIAIGWGAFLRF